MQCRTGLVGAEDDDPDIRVHVAAHRDRARALLDGLLGRLGGTERSVPVVVACVVLAAVAIVLAVVL